MSNEDGIRRGATSQPVNQVPLPSSWDPEDEESTETSKLLSSPYSSPSQSSFPLPAWRASGKMADKKEFEVGTTTSYDFKNLSSLESRSLPPTAGAVFETAGLEDVLYKPIPTYEGIHRYDPKFQWEEQEERKVVRKVGSLSSNVLFVRFLC
jgi:hypothetical protein